MNYGTLKEVYTDSTFSIAEWGDLIWTLLVRLYQQTNFTDIGKNMVVALFTTIWELRCKNTDTIRDWGRGPMPSMDLS